MPHSVDAVQKSRNSIDRTNVAQPVQAAARVSIVCLKVHKYAYNRQATGKKKIFAIDRADRLSFLSDPDRSIHYAATAL
jgi:hypothetical protein